MAVHDELLKLILAREAMDAGASEELAVRIAEAVHKQRLAMRMTLAENLKMVHEARIMAAHGQVVEIR